MAKIAVCHRLMINLSFGTQAWYDAGAGSYFAPASTLFAIQLFLFGWVEGRRMQDYNKPGMPTVTQADDIHLLSALPWDILLPSSLNFRSVQARPTRTPSSRTTSCQVVHLLCLFMACCV